jgi:hypothetical protein
VLALRLHVGRRASGVAASHGFQKPRARPNGAPAAAALLPFWGRRGHREAASRRRPGCGSAPKGSAKWVYTWLSWCNYRPTLLDAKNSKDGLSATSPIGRAGRDLSRDGAGLGIQAARDHVRAGVQTRSRRSKRQSPIAA